MTKIVKSSKLRLFLILLIQKFNSVYKIGSSVQKSYLINFTVFNNSFWNYENFYFILLYLRSVLSCSHLLISLQNINNFILNYA